MQIKPKKKEKYLEIWNAELKCDLTQEFKAYRYLCEDMGVRERKKYEKSQGEKFDNYTKWERHINSILNNLSHKNQRKEFERFLLHRIRIVNSESTISVGYLLPIVAACAGIYIEDFLKEIINAPNIFTVLVGAMAFFGCLVWLMDKVYKQTRGLDLKRAFYEDILAILQNKIE